MTKGKSKRIKLNNGLDEFNIRKNKSIKECNIRILTEKFLDYEKNLSRNKITNIQNYYNYLIENGNKKTCVTVA